MASFLDRVHKLPRLGYGVSTEYGAHRQQGALDLAALRTTHPGVAQFLEVGVEVARGIDADTRGWVDDGLPTTYHFLDVNLDDPRDLDAAWLDAVRATVEAVRPAWMCGDAGLWHFGRRDRGHMLLLPPILVPEAIAPMADGLCALREATGLEVLPENPPGAAFVGRLHLLDFFGRVADEADTGLLIDCAHLAMYQRAKGLPALAGMDGLPYDRVIELHIAGGTPHDHHGLPWIDDDHGTAVLADTWQIAAHLGERCPNLRAIVVECERNGLHDVVDLMAQTRDRVGWA